MKETGILFRGEDVRATLDGRKTQTRRMVKPQPSESSDNAFLGLDGIWRFSHPTIRGPVSHEADDVKCPFGSVGDALWVRETFALEHQVDHDQKWPFNDGRPIKLCKEGWVQPHYRATDPAPELAYGDCDEPCVKWKASRHMPRWASRINLEITGVRVERLNEISEEDAIAEGIEVWSKTDRRTIWNCPAHVRRSGEGDNVEDVAFLGCGVKSPIEAYRGTWESINGAGSWDKNPWVWVIEFRRI